MPAKFNFTDAKKRVKTTAPIELSDGSTFTILLKRPSYEHQLFDVENTQGYQQRRMDECVVGWEDLNDENDDPIPFKKQTFERLCELEPGILFQVVNAVQRLFVGLDASAKGNFGEPSGESSTGDQAKQTSTSPDGTSRSTSTSADLASSSERPASLQSTGSDETPTTSKD